MLPIFDGDHPTLSLPFTKGVDLDHKPKILRGKKKQACVECINAVQTSPSEHV